MTTTVDQFDVYTLRGHLPAAILGEIKDFGAIREPTPSARAMKEGFAFLDDCLENELGDLLEVLLDHEEEAVGIKYFNKWQTWLSMTHPHEEDIAYFERNYGSHPWVELMTQSMDRADLVPYGGDCHKGRIWGP